MIKSIIEKLRGLLGQKKRDPQQEKSPQDLVLQDVQYELIGQLLADTINQTSYAMHPDRSLHFGWHKGMLVMNGTTLKTDLRYHLGEAFPGVAIPITKGGQIRTVTVEEWKPFVHWILRQENVRVGYGMRKELAQAKLLRK